MIQLRTDFLGTAISLVPEFSLISNLFKRAAYGIAFGGETKRIVAEKLKQLSTMPPLGQLMQLIHIFQLLAISTDGEKLNNDLNSTNFILKDKIRMGAVYEYIDTSYHQKPDVNIVAQKVNLTTPAFCRYFKRQTNITFTEFVNQYRIERAKNLLMQNRNVSETCYAVGFESLSYFNKLFKQVVGENPSNFRRRWHNR